MQMDIRGEEIFVDNSVFFPLDPLPLLDPVGKMKILRIQKARMMEFMASNDPSNGKPRVFRRDLSLHVAMAFGFL